MATIEKARPADGSRIAICVLVGVATVLSIAIAVHFFTRPPQMGTDEDAFKSVDALYTAVRMKDAAKIDQCERRLHGYRDAGKLEAAPSEFLDSVIAQAREGKWESATERLYEFMSAQRREGRSTPVEEKPAKRPVKR